MQTRSLDLAELAEAISKSFPSTSKLYLFGSRLYQTGSTRSDIDLLIEFEEPIPSIPQLGDWVQAHEPYLDFFVMHNGSATSAINGSQIVAVSQEELLTRLGAELLWDQGTWVSCNHKTHKVLDEWAPVPTMAAPGAPAYKAIDIPPPCDYLIVSGLPKEHAAMRRELEDPRLWSPAGQLAPTFEISLMGTARGRTKHIAAVVCPRMGVAPAALTTRSLIDFLNPDLVILTGLAGAIAKDEISLGDLVIPDAIFDYEAVKVTPEGEESHAMIAPVAVTAYRSIKQLDLMPWIHKIEKQRLGENALKRWWRSVKGASLTPLKIHFDGPMASGQKVVADEERGYALRAIHRKTSSIDMEAWGVAEACAFSATPTPFVVIKAISDYADKNKTDDWHDFGCRASASLIAELIRQDVI